MRITLDVLGDRAAATVAAMQAVNAAQAAGLTVRRAVVADDGGEIEVYPAERDSDPHDIRRVSPLSSRGART